MMVMVVMWDDGDGSDGDGGDGGDGDGGDVMMVGWW